MLKLEAPIPVRTDTATEALEANPGGGRRDRDRTIL